MGQVKTRCDSASSSSCCASCAGHDHGPQPRYQVVRLILGAVAYGGAILWSAASLGKVGLYLTAYLLLGAPTLLRAFRNIGRGQIFDESFLMAVATGGALAIGEYPEAVAVMLFYEIGEWLQGLAAGRSRRSIEALIDVRPEYANLIMGDQDELQVVLPQEVQPGQRILVRPGERVPLDGRILAGRSFVDTVAITGEPIPREVGSGEGVFAGFVNQTGPLTIEVDKPFGQSAVARILELVEEAGTRKSPTEGFITRFARYYTPIVVFTAIALALVPPVLLGLDWHTWIYRALIFLVISCPCALMVSVPLGFFAGLGAAARRGILIKGASFLEEFNTVDTAVFDKTGTLTQGLFTVDQMLPQPGVTADQLLELAAHAEQHSLHPIAESIRQAWGQPIEQGRATDFEEISGEGVVCRVDEQQVAVGNIKLMSRLGVEMPDSSPGKAGVVHLAKEDQYVGRVIISDQLRSDALPALKTLRQLGVTRLAMLTGDRQSVAEAVGEQLGLDTIAAELLPHEKVTHLERLMGEADRGSTIFVGDGINDAPVLARADVGVAMGGLGSEAALEAADVVLMTDELSRLGDAILIARRTRSIVWQNIIMAFAVKGIVLALGGAGVATLWEAVFADVGVALLAVLNSMRIMTRPLVGEPRLKHAAVTSASGAA